MPIPPIPAYAVPDAAALPPSVAGWWPDPDRAVLLLHDMQRYFLAPFAAGPRAVLEGHVARLRDAADRAGVPVVYTAQPGSMTAGQRGLLHDFWGPGMARDDGSPTVPDGLAPRPGDTVFTKWRYSAFHDTDLDAFLRDRGRDQLVVTGVYANTGCLVTAVDAFSRDLETFVVRDAVADFSAAEHRQALTYAATRCAVVLDTDAVLAAVASPVRLAG